MVKFPMLFYIIGEENVAHPINQGENSLIL